MPSSFGASLRSWRLYADYSSGISTDLLVHQTDISNFVMGKTVPVSCVASGGIYRWTDAGDDRDVADTVSALYEYPKAAGPRRQPERNPDGAPRE
jgi:predicted dehydrogenase